MTEKQLRLEDETSNIRTMTPVAAAVMTALWPASAVVAQDQEASDDTIEEIVTTGSRIRKDNFSSAAPMDIVLTEEAAVRGISDVATMLQTTTVAAGSPQVTSASSAIGFSNAPLDNGLGSSSISMRGLGANRTLVLLNGRRAGPSGVGGSVSAFDLNAIPLSAVERVEVLKDGASSIYGSDAVAGVINIITKKTEGFGFEAFVSQPTESGGEQTRINGSWGKEFDRGYFRATADYNKTKILQREDREFFDCEEEYIFDQDTGERADLIDPRTGTYHCNDLPWGHVWVYDYADATDDDGVPLYGDGTTNAGPPSYLLQYDFDGHLSANGVSPLAPPTNPNHMVTPEGWYPIRQGDALSDSLYDSQHPLHGTQTLMPESEVMTLFLEAEYELDDNVTAYSEFLLNRRETENVGYRQIWTYMYNYDGADWPGWTDPPVLGGAGSDPFAAGWTGAQWLSPLSITDHNDSEVTVDYSRVVLGLKGETENFLAGWNWDLSFQYSKSDGDYTNDRVYTDALEYAFWRTAGCAGEITPISGTTCVDIDWLDPNFLAGDIPQNAKDFLFGADTGNTEYTQWSVEGFMTGDVFEMPAGTVAMAVGFHYREDEINDTPGEVVLAENAWQDDAAGITKGDDSTVAVFAEIDIPLVSDKTMVEYLDFNASVRYTDVDSYGDDTTYKVGMNWALTDSFRVRSTFGTSFRTPALYELYLADQSNSISARNADPCISWQSNLEDGFISQRTAQNCEADGIPPDHIATVSAAVLTGGGAGLLTAETSEATTFGIVWQPNFADLSVSVDYFDILVEDEVDRIGGRAIVAGCYESLFFPDEPLCDQFTRSSAGASLPNAILNIYDQFINVSKQQIRGVDVAAQYTQEIGNWGAVTVNTQWTRNLEDTVALFDDTEEDLSGLAGHPETVGNVYVTLNKDAWSFYWGIDYIGSTDNRDHFGFDTVNNSEGNPVGIDLKADAVTYHSLSGSYMFDNGLTARIGVANLLDERPPRMTARGTGNEVNILGEVAFYSQYDWLGRRYFVNLAWDFE